MSTTIEMTQPYTTGAMDDIPQSEQELLQRLIGEGLSSTNITSTLNPAVGESDPTINSSLESSRYRKLLQVLFQACILNPISRQHAPSQAGFEQAYLTLDILYKQTSSRPELLYSLPSDGDSQPKVPLCQWLLPRIINAASRFEDVEGAEKLVDQLCDAAVNILLVLSRDLSEGDPTCMKGPQRLIYVIRSLIGYCQDTINDKHSSLMGFTELPDDILPLLFTLHIILQTPVPTIRFSSITASHILAHTARLIASLPPNRQARYTTIVTRALHLSDAKDNLVYACVSIVKFAHTGDGRLDSAINTMLKAIRSSGLDLCRDVWSAISQQRHDLSLLEPLGKSKATFLLTPNPPFYASQSIISAIPDTISTWASQCNEAIGLDDIKALLVSLDTSSVPRKSLKLPENEDRKRNVIQFVRQTIQGQSEDLTLLAQDWLNFAQRSNDEDRNNLHKLFLQLLSVSKGCFDSLTLDYLSEWLRLSTKSDSETLNSLQSLCALYEHQSKAVKEDGKIESRHRLLSSMSSNFLNIVQSHLTSPNRRLRIASSRAFALIFQHRTLEFQGDMIDKINSEHKLKLKGIGDFGSIMLSRLDKAMTSPSLPVRETALLLLGKLACEAAEWYLCDLLEKLILQFGSRNSPLQSLAFSQLLAVSSYRRKRPYNLLSPYLSRIGLLLARHLTSTPELVAETMLFIGYNRQAFFNLDPVRKAVIPQLVIDQNKEGLQQIASILREQLGVILVDEGPLILSKIFLHPNPQQGEKALRFVVNLVSHETNKDLGYSVMLDKYMKASIINLIVTLVIELGNDDSNARTNATLALSRAHAVEAEHTSGKRYQEDDLGSFLKPHMLGVLSMMNEQLSNPRSTINHRRKIIRSLGQLTELVGDSMASFSPQIIASLQSNLGQNKDLDLDTLMAWFVYVEKLKFSDIGPIIGPTIAALIARWSSFDETSQEKAAEIILYIVGHVDQLRSYLDDVVAFDHIPRLKQASQKMLHYRKDWKLPMFLSKLLERIENKNIAVSTSSMRELRELLLSKSTEIMQFARGDTFDPLIARLMRSLLGAVNRDGVTEELLDLSYECFGLIGALDPDRFVQIPDETNMTILSNFSDHDESIDFALHLIRDLLVGAFRATSDTKHQKNLAYCIQELLRFCGFDSRILRENSTVPAKTRHKWSQLPKHLLETLTPLLDAQFKQNQQKTTIAEYPIYTSQPTYRQWIQAWTVDLIGRVKGMRMADVLSDAQMIFGVFNSEPKNQDVAVAHHILPHLVLHVLLSGSKEMRERISLELHTVLLDQVNPQPDTGADKRMLSAQVIFDLMDHMSKWLRLQRRNVKDRNERSSYISIVEKVLSSIDTQLLANAAFKSRAYARSLQNFEQRIIELRAEQRDNSQLQIYFENLHEIYADLDEPDGMEGVSAFVISPSLELQIREHESTGRWTSAQSCWEVRLQQSPNDVKLHIGLLKCLRNLGHYDTLRTHIQGVLSRHQEWSQELAPFQAEAAWTIGDWQTLSLLRNNESAPMAKVFMAIQERKHEAFNSALKDARRIIGASINSRQYSRVYEPILELSMLREIEMIYQADQEMKGTKNIGRGGVESKNEQVIIRSIRDKVVSQLSDRFSTTLPAFRVREEILSKRRTALSLVQSPLLRIEFGQAWIQSAKIARKAGYEQTAYSAALQATEVEASYAFIQQAKLLRAHGGALKALTGLENSLRPIKERKQEAAKIIDLTGQGRTEEDFRDDRALAKAVLLDAKWANESDRFDRNDVIERFKEAISLGETLESPYFHLGHYYDSQAEVHPDNAAQFHQQTCHYYIEALTRGVKYIYQTMPRLLTIWLDLGEMQDKETKTAPQVARVLDAVSKQMERARGRISTWQFLMAFPQLISRIIHPHKKTQEILIKYIARVIRDYPKQSLWPTVGVMQSKRPDRQEICQKALMRAVSNDHSGNVQNHIEHAKKLSSVLLKLAEDHKEEKKGHGREFSMATSFPYVGQVFPSQMIVPLQDALTCTLPTMSETVATHQPFPNEPVSIYGFYDKIEVMPSLQRPKKIVFIGSDGRRYPFLCKPHDDLRKDARLMDFNSMINKLLKSAGESRRRQLYIRTYAVTPLNEECGLLEWVSNTTALKSILEKGYARQGKKIHSGEVYTSLDPKKYGPEALISAFKDKVIPMYSPTVFHEWFLITWPEPTAWFASRMNYARTLAVMSMIGYVLGLGDRHGENILFDSLTGDTVHVDLNCLFEKGKTFEIPERVPFRLTHNMVDAMGVTGVEGVFRKASEITMNILRTNADSLMSVLEAFVHDPLVEWTNQTKKNHNIRASADKNLRPIRAKLRGIMHDTTMTVPNQVEALIKEATSLNSLALMYVGWAAWL